MSVKHSQSNRFISVLRHTRFETIETMMTEIAELLEMTSYLFDFHVITSTVSYQFNIRAGGY